MEQTFLLSIRLSDILSPYKESVLQEIHTSSLTKLPHYVFSNGFVRYTGKTSQVTIGLDYLLDELLPLDTFVALAISEDSYSIRGKGYKHHIFTPSILFESGKLKLSGLPIYQKESEEALVF